MAPEEAGNLLKLLALARGHRLHRELLTGGSRMAEPRQQTLRATLDWSHDLLSDPERGLFRRLSPSPGPARMLHW